MILINWNSREKGGNRLIQNSKEKSLIIFFKFIKEKLLNTILN